MPEIIQLDVAQLAEILEIPAEEFDPLDATIINKRLGTLHCTTLDAVRTLLRYKHKLVRLSEEEVAQILGVDPKQIDERALSRLNKHLFGYGEKNFVHAVKRWQSRTHNRESYPSLVVGSL